MPRRRLPARLYLRRARDDRNSAWVILDGAKEIGTGASPHERGRAEDALQAYLAKSYRPPVGADKPHELLVSEVIGRYVEEHAATLPPKTACWIADLAPDILAWWGDKSLAEVNGRSCRAYVVWRTAQRVRKFKKQEAPLVGVSTARHELALLHTAIRYYHREHGPLQSVPVVTLPPKPPQRDDYFWTRDEAARRLRAARRSPNTHHIARLILIGLYSGTRPGAMMKLRWLPSTDGGWVDLDNEIIHRRAPRASRTKKRQPPARIHRHLLPHLRRWHQADMQRGIASVIHFAGKPVTNVYTAWTNVRIVAGTEQRDAPHVLRHTAATLFMQAGLDVAAIAGYLGMSVRVLMSVYAHHHPMFQTAIAQATPKKQVNRGGTQ